MKELRNIQVLLKVNKSQYNSFGNYNFRNCEDILEALKPLLGEFHCIINLSDEVVYVGTRHYVKATATIKNDSGESESASGWAREIGEKKKFDESQLTGTASSYARKTALGGLLALDDTKDADSMDNRPEIPKKARKKEGQTKTPPVSKRLAKFDDPREAITQFFLVDLPDGTFANGKLNEIQAFKNELGAYTFVDDAHKFDVGKHFTTEHDQFWQKQESEGK